MKLINQSSEIWGQCPTSLNEAILWIEKAGRVCYRSEDRIIEGSGLKFVNGIIARKHFAVIEHSNLVITTTDTVSNPQKELADVRGSMNSPYLHSFIMKDKIYAGGNFRAWMEQLKLSSIDAIFDFINDNPYFEIVTDPQKIPLPLQMVTVEFITDRAVTHELVRHRPASYCQESQRYVKYDGNMLFITPSWFESNLDGNEVSPADSCFLQSMRNAETDYRFLRKAGMSPQNARVVLPNQTATKIVMTASIPEWSHVFNLRCDSAAYGAMINLMAPIRDEFINRNWIMPVIK